MRNVTSTQLAYSWPAHAEKTTTISRPVIALLHPLGNNYYHGIVELMSR